MRFLFLRSTYDLVSGLVLGFRLVWFLLLTLFLHSVDLVDSATWLIVDGPAPKAQHGGSGRMVVLSSPNDDNFHEFGKAV